MFLKSVYKLLTLITNDGIREVIVVLIAKKELLSYYFYNNRFYRF